MPVVVIAMEAFNRHSKDIFPCWGEGSYREGRPLKAVVHLDGMTLGPGADAQGTHDKVQDLP